MVVIGRMVDRAGVGKGCMTAVARGAVAIDLILEVVVTRAAAVRKARLRGNSQPTEVSAAQADVETDVVMAQAAVAKRISHVARLVAVGHSRDPAVGGWAAASSIPSADTRARTRPRSAVEARVLAGVKTLAAERKDDWSAQVPLARTGQVCVPTMRDDLYDVVGSAEDDSVRELGPNCERFHYRAVLRKPADP